MPSQSINAHVKQGQTFSEWVWFTGSTALLEGQGVCYDWDRGTLTSADARRFNYVELPSVTNDNTQCFAGVAARKYSASSGGQFIEIYRPGSTCNILCKADVVVGTNLRLTCEAGGTYAGYFRYVGFPGEGSARVLQTVSCGTTAGKCYAHLETGEPSGLVESVVTNTDGLLDGGATTFMVGGVSYIDANISTGGNATATLANGIVPGLKKAFVCRVAQTTGAVVVTVTAGEKGIADADPTSNLSSISLNADLEETTLEWNAFDTNGRWVITHSIGTTIG